MRRHVDLLNEEHWQDYTPHEDEPEPHTISELLEDAISCLDGVRHGNSTPASYTPAVERALDLYQYGGGGHLEPDFRYALYHNLEAGRMYLRELLEREDRIDAGRRSGRIEIP